MNESRELEAWNVIVVAPNGAQTITAFRIPWHVARELVIEHLADWRNYASPANNPINCPRVRLWSEPW